MNPRDRKSGVDALFGCLLWMVMATIAVGTLMGLALEWGVL